VFRSSCLHYLILGILFSDPENPQKIPFQTKATKKKQQKQRKNQSFFAKTIDKSLSI
jgi:hypothetical protein